MLYGELIAVDVVVAVDSNWLGFWAEAVEYRYGEMKWINCVSAESFFSYKEAQYKDENRLTKMKNTTKKRIINDQFNHVINVTLKKYKNNNFLKKKS